MSGSEVATVSDAIESLVAEHASEASFLWLQRADAVDAPNYSPEQFADLDERLAAHIDGLRVAGPDGWRLATMPLEEGDVEDFFAPSVLAIENHELRFDDIIRRAESKPEVAPALISALGWVHPSMLSRRVKALLMDPSPFRQMLGLAACASHRKDPGALLEQALQSTAANVRTRALRTAGELGRVDLLPRVLAGLGDDKREARYWAARSAVLLGHRGTALDVLQAIACERGSRQISALQLVVQAMDAERAHALLQQLGEVVDGERLRIIAAGLSGQVRYVPWLIEKMAGPTFARVAAEAFVNITGADFNTSQLEDLPPEDFEEGPSEDPADENVDVPQDLALLWPAVPRVRAWWADNGSSFNLPARYFLGAPLTATSCSRILRTGFQRQRVAAARFLCLLEPGRLLFNTSAPAWRQQEQLASPS